VALGCGSTESGEEVLSPEERVVRALIDHLRIEGGVVNLQPIPPTTDGTVNLLSDTPFEPLEPGEGGLLPFTQDNPNADDDASSAVLLQFGDDDRHIEVPVSRSVGEMDALSFAYSLDEEVCEELCNRRYTIALSAAIKLQSGGIGTLDDAAIVLDFAITDHKLAGVNDDSDKPRVAVEAEVQDRLAGHRGDPHAHRIVQCEADRGFDPFLVQEQQREVAQPVLRCGIEASQSRHAGQHLAPDRIRYRMAQQRSPAPPAFQHPALRSGILRNDTR
jgi:hypothetical protein